MGLSGVAHCGHRQNQLHVVCDCVHSCCTLTVISMLECQKKFTEQTLPSLSWAGTIGTSERTGVQVAQRLFSDRDGAANTYKHPYINPSILVPPPDITTSTYVHEHLRIESVVRVVDR